MVATFAICACGDRAPDRLAYGPFETAGQRIDACWLAVADGTVAYVRVANDTAWEGFSADCVANEPYAMPYREYEVGELHIVAGEDISPMTLIAVDERTEAVPNLPHEAGAEGLVAIREAKGKYFVTRWIDVRAGDGEASDPSVSLPTEWDELRAQMDSTDPASCGPGQPDKAPDEAAFASYMYEPTEEFCP